jgi:hypothetical protein
MFQTGHGPEKVSRLVACTEFFRLRGDLGSDRLVGQFSGQVAAQNGAPVVWLQPKILFCLPLPFSDEVTSDQYHTSKHTMQDQT